MLRTALGEPTIHNFFMPRKATARGDGRKDDQPAARDGSLIEDLLLVVAGNRS